MIKNKLRLVNRLINLGNEIRKYLRARFMQARLEIKELKTPEGNRSPTAIINYASIKNIGTLNTLISVIKVESGLLILKKKTSSTHFHPTCLWIFLDFFFYPPPVYYYSFFPKKFKPPPFMILQLLHSRHVYYNNLCCFSNY